MRRHERGSHAVYELQKAKDNAPTAERFHSKDATPRPRIPLEVNSGVLA